MKTVEVSQIRIYCSMNKILQEIRKSLKENIDEKAKKGFQRYFKEKVKFYGLKSAAADRIEKKYFEILKNEDKNKIFELCEELLKSGYCEEAWIAGHWADRLQKKFKPSDFVIFERWIKKYIDNWAECDTLCNHAVCAFIERYPKYIDKLKVWTKSKNRWMKRAAAVTLIIPARKGKFLKNIFQIADNLLTDPDDMVQKGYGWMLKAASQAHQNEVFNYVMKNKSVMPRTALRYAIEKMPQALRKKAMAKS